MQQMLSLGAFAGLSAQDSYRVIADASVNTPDSMDQGRFIVELQVAPSVPMRFLTVQLVQSGGQLTLSES
jgi:phage tail sheath protein FI